MARFRLSTDILSPLNSDISLNDLSVFSFESFPGTPVYDNDFASPICSAKQDTSINLLCERSMQECASTFDEITNDIKKQSIINSTKEEKYKGTYAELKRSMDNLFGKDFNSPYFSPHLSDESKNSTLESKMHPETNEFTEFQMPKNSKLLAKNKCSDLKNISEATNRKSEKGKKGKSVTKPKHQQHQSKRASSTSESLKSTKSKNEVPKRNDSIVSEKKDVLVDKKKISKMPSKDDKASIEAKKDSIVSEKKDVLVDKKKISKISSKDNKASIEAKGTSSKSLFEKKKDKGTEVVKGYDFKCQKKIPVSENISATENKSLSIEKSIQLAVSMETDNIRRFVLEQNLFLRKDLIKLQEMVKKQNEVTEYLFSVIDELLDTNKKLISKRN